MVDAGRTVELPGLSRLFATKTRYGYRNKSWENLASPIKTWIRRKNGQNPTVLYVSRKRGCRGHREHCVNLAWILFLSLCSFSIARGFILCLLRSFSLYCLPFLLHLLNDKVSYSSGTPVSLRSAHFRLNAGHMRSVSSLTGKQGNQVYQQRSWLFRSQIDE